jgi:hypothetical protein
MMWHWSNEDPAELAVAANAAAAAAPLVERTPIERVAEILESLWAKEPDLVSELVTELGRCDPTTMARLFGSQSTRVAMNYGPPSSEPADVLGATVETFPVSPGTQEPDDEKAHAEALQPAIQYGAATPEQLLANLQRAQYDENGKRTNPGRKAFDIPMPRPRRSWMSF